MLPPTNYPKPTRSRNRSGSVLGCLIVLVLFLIIIGVGWIFLVRPYIHTIAQNGLDHVMTSAVDHIPAQAALLPAGSTLPVQDNTINNLIVLNTAPSSPVQPTTAHITPNAVRIEFQLYGQSCAISQVPKSINGQLVATNVTVEGIIGWVMSPDELTTLLNKHYADAQTRIHHPIKEVQLKNGEMDVTLG